MRQWILLCLVLIITFASAGAKADAVTSFSSSTGESDAPTPYKRDKNSLYPDIRAATEKASQIGEVLDVETMPHWSGDSVLSKTGYRTVIARTNQEWDSLWLVANQPKPMDLPAGKMGIAVFLGDRATNGYSVRVFSLRHNPDDDSYRISILENKPRVKAQAATRSLTSSPWVIYLVPRATGSVRFFR